MRQEPSTLHAPRRGWVIQPGTCWCTEQLFASLLRRGHHTVPPPSFPSLFLETFPQRLHTDRNLTKTKVGWVWLTTEKKACTKTSRQHSGLSPACPEMKHVSFNCQTLLHKTHLNHTMQTNQERVSPQMLIQEHLATCLAEGSNASQAYQRTLHDMMKQHPPKKKVYQLGLALKTKILNQENQMKTERRQKKKIKPCAPY